MTKKTWIRLTFILLITVGFLFFFFRRFEWKSVWSSLTDVNVTILVLAILMVPLHLVTRAFRWRYLLIHEKKDVKFYNLFAGNAVGFTVTFLLPGRLGEIVKPLYLAKKEGVRPGFVLGTVVVERIFDMFTMCFLLGVFLLAKPLYASTFRVEAEAYAKLNYWGIIGVAFATVLLGVSLFFYFFRERALKTAAFFLKPFPQKIGQKILTLLHEFIDGLKFFHSLRNLLVYAGLSYVVWLGITFFYWVFFQAFGIQPSFFLLIPYIFLTMIGASIPTPGMLGGFHQFSKLGLVELYGVDPNLALGATIVVHALQLVVTCLIGYAILWKDGLSLFQLKRLGETMDA